LQKQIEYQRQQEVKRKKENLLRLAKGPDLPPIEPPYLLMGYCSLYFLSFLTFKFYFNSILLALLLPLFFYYLFFTIYTNTILNKILTFILKLIKFLFSLKSYCCCCYREKRRSSTITTTKKNISSSLSSPSLSSLSSLIEKGKVNKKPNYLAVIPLLRRWKKRRKSKKDNFTGEDEKNSASPVVNNAIAPTSTNTSNSTT